MWTHAVVFFIFFTILDENGKSLGPNRVWMKSVNIPGLAMSRSLGDTVASEIGVISIPDIYEITLKENHKILIIASDGIWGVLSNEKVIQIAGRYYKKGNAEMACENLIQEALLAWNNEGSMIDDITVIVVFFK